MGQPSNIAVAVDNTEYSRYEDNHKVITSTISISGNGPYTAETIYVELVKARRSRDAVVASTPVSMSGTSPAQQAVTFNLPDIVDQDMISLVRHGKYFVQARSPATGSSVVIGTSSAAPITLQALDTGTDTNSFTAQILVPSGTNELYVTKIGNMVTISLATTASVPEASKNTRENLVAFINNNLANTIYASFTGSAGLVLSVAEASTPFTGGRDEVVGESVDFDIRVVTVDRLKKDFLFGIPMYASQIRFPFNQPVNITGVTITEVSTSHPLGLFSLNYTYVTNPDSSISRFLSWDGGPLVSVSNPGTYILRRGSGAGGGSCGGKSGLLSAVLGQDYIIVKSMGSAFLPTASTSDEILIENARLDDAALARYLCAAESWVEKIALQVYIEPTNVVTDRDPTTIQFAAGINSPTPLYTDPDYDEIVGPLTYFPPRPGNEWIEIQTPYNALLRVDSMFGSIANTRVIDIDLDWIQFYPVGGMIQLIPYSQAVAFDYLGLIWVGSLRGPAAIPNFWHFNMIVGLRDAPCDIRDLIAKKAAMDALIMLGAALRPGIGSQSLGRDGVSQSTSYNTQLKFGPYSGQIMAFQDWIDKTLSQYRGVYRGPLLRVV
jgi:hypothetical protein